MLMQIRLFYKTLPSYNNNNMMVYQTIYIYVS